MTGFMIDAPERAELFKIVLFQLPFMLLINSSRNLLKWTFVRAHFLMMSLGFTLVQASLLVAAVFVFDVGVKGVLVVNLITCIIFGLLGLFFVRKWLILPKDFSRLREMLPYAIPLGIICVAGAFSPTLERSITASLLGAESLGLYAVGTKIAMLMGLLVSAFQTAWGPFSLSLYKQTDAGNTYNWVFKLFALVVCLAALTLTLLAQPLIAILATDRYLGALIVVFPLAMGAAIQSTSWITEIGIGIAKRSHLNLYSYAVAILVTLVGIWLLTPILGLFGVGLGVLLGHVARALTASWLAQRVYPLPWQYVPVVFLMTVTTMGGMASIWIGEQLGLLIGNLLLGSTIFLVIIVGWLVLFSQADRIRVKELISQLWIMRIKKK
jgi:O-antigen/teichoic acid export membrane protein